ncbi:hypothetical protein ANN_21558 [Periplaneta americana]|uniref:Uncharacterized protein n=1 Tax=Periplaneta americana TaxID=6978 RepID=A0ABQ8S5V1_PERAM|nr:hypothetical protein ANN_21558 [Periplaneta americana]
MAGLCEGGNEPPGSLKASNFADRFNGCGYHVRHRGGGIVYFEVKITTNLWTRARQYRGPLVSCVRAARSCNKGFKANTSVKKLLAALP